MRIFNYLLLLYTFPCYIASEGFIQNPLFTKLDIIHNICINVIICRLHPFLKTSSDMEIANLRNSFENKLQRKGYFEKSLFTKF